MLRKYQKVNNLMDNLSIISFFKCITKRITKRITKPQI